MNDALSPRRRCTLTLSIQADDREALSRALQVFATKIDRDEISSEGASGGHDSGWVYGFDEDETITHDSYVKALDVLLGREALSQN